MIVAMEFNEDKHSKMAKAVKCILETAEYIKDLIEHDDALEYRKRDMRYKHRDDEYYDYDRRRSHDSRYM